MEILEIVGFNGESLPENLQKLFPNRDSRPGLYYASHLIQLDELSDEIHIVPLEQALAEQKIAHWSCGKQRAFAMPQALAEDLALWNEQPAADEYQAAREEERTAYWYDRGWVITFDGEDDDVLYSAYPRSKLR